MEQKLSLRRLTQLYADIDVPAFKPVEYAPGADAVSASLPALTEEQPQVIILLPEPDQIESMDSDEKAGSPDLSIVPLPADLVPDSRAFPAMEQIEYVDPSVAAEAVALGPLFANPAPEVIISPETDQIESTDGTADVSAVSTLTFLADPAPYVIEVPQRESIESVALDEIALVPEVAISPVIAEALPVPVNPGLSSEAALENSGPARQSLDTGEPRQADWKAIGIGAMTGTIVSAIILLLTSQMNIFNNTGRLVLWGAEMFLGIIGGLIANSWKSTARELWRASIEWTLYPVGLALLVGFILLLLMFTSLTG